EAYLSPAGVFIESAFEPPGFYLIDNSGARLVATRDQGFDSVLNWLFLGFKSEGELLFCPGAINNIYPCQVYGGNGLTAVTDPTPYQALGQYVDGVLVYSTYGTAAGHRVMRHVAGQPDELLMDENTVPDLNVHLDFDGESIAFVTGHQDENLVVWLRRADGTRKRIIGHGDPLPGSAGTMRGFAIPQGTFVDQGRVFLATESLEKYPIWPDRVFLASDGDTTEVLFKAGQEIPGRPGVTLDGFAVGQVRDGRIWVTASLAAGKTLFLIENGTWTAVASPTDTFDGRNPVGLGSFRHGARGDDVVIPLTFLGPNWRPINELYTNADLPGFKVVGPVTAAPVQVAVTEDNQWRFTTTAEAGKLHTLEFSTTLTNWQDAADPILAEEVRELEWLLPQTAGPLFFRVRVETP
ncbi:MAG: hypothetical protein KDM81_07555, partial [Verrucomicrobiae bacterium]|nr:hypothetical protein [Verrucomicrobiae bacterium]